MLNQQLDILQWAFRTARADHRTYKSHRQTISVQRLWGAVVPNLRRPIFIIGAPRSGTTFLGECLAALPEVSYHFEPIAGTGAAAFIYNKTWSFMKARLYYRQLYSWLTRIHFDGHLRFAVKDCFNSFLVSFLFQSFPDSQFIHIIRDGRDAALSLSKKPWLQSATNYYKKESPAGIHYGSYARFWVEEERKGEFETTSDIHRCIWSWRRHVESALAASTMLSCAQYYEVRYEVLASEPVREAERLLDYLGISAPESRRQFHNAVGKVNKNSIGNWRKELTPIQLNQVEKEAGPLLKQLCYS